MLVPTVSAVFRFAVLPIRRYACFVSVSVSVLPLFRQPQRFENRLLNIYIYIYIYVFIYVFITFDLYPERRGAAPSTPDPISTIIVIIIVVVIIMVIELVVAIVIVVVVAVAVVVVMITINIAGYIIIHTGKNLLFQNQSFQKISQISGK